MSVEAMRWAKAQKVTFPSHSSVLRALADYATPDGLAWPSQQTLASDLSLTDRTIRSALTALERDRLIIRYGRRNRDGTRKVDKIQLVMTARLQQEAEAHLGRKLAEAERRGERSGAQAAAPEPRGAPSAGAGAAQVSHPLPPPERGEGPGASADRINRKSFPVVQPPENDNLPTGNSFRSHRKQLPQPPEMASSATGNGFRETTTREPPEGNHHRNGSGPNGPGGDAAERPAASRAGTGLPALVEAAGGDGSKPLAGEVLPAPVLAMSDRCWIEGKANLQDCGASARDAGQAIGHLLKRGHDHASVLWATEQAKAARTGDPLRYMQAALRGALERGGIAVRRASGRRSGMLAVLMDDFGVQP